MLHVLASQHTAQHVTRVQQRREESLVREEGGGQGHGRDVLETVAEGQSVSVSARHRSRLHRLFLHLSTLQSTNLSNLLLLLLIRILLETKNKQTNEIAVSISGAPHLSNSNKK